jgi:acyl dehydratase
VWDKDKAAKVVIEYSSVDSATQIEAFRTRMTLFVRGAGGWGGEGGPKTAWALPEREPDHTMVDQTAPDQALRYRLCGDRNRLHSDPGFAVRAGRALVRAIDDGDPRRFARIDARFSSPVFPGDQLTTEIWRTDEQTVLFRTLGPNDTVVLTNGTLTLR